MISNKPKPSVEEVLISIPNSIKLGWRTYKIEQGEHRTGTNGGDLYGEIKYEDGSIYIYQGQNEENKMVTLLHEILHWICYNSGHEDWRTNEDLITMLSENLYQIIKENHLKFE